MRGRLIEASLPEGELGAPGTGAKWKWPEAKPSLLDVVLAHRLLGALHDFFVGEVFEDLTDIPAVAEGVGDDGGFHTPELSGGGIDFSGSGRDGFGKGGVGIFCIDDEEARGTSSLGEGVGFPRGVFGRDVEEGVSDGEVCLHNGSVREGHPGQLLCAEGLLIEVESGGNVFDGKRENNGRIGGFHGSDILIVLGILSSDIWWLKLAEKFENIETNSWGA